MRTEKKDTGIFVQTKTTAEGWKESYKLLSAMVKLTIHSELKEWEDEALRILRENDFDGFPCDLPESAPLAAKDARALIYAIMGTRDYIKRNDARNAALCAFQAGHIATRMGTRPFEKPAKAGRRGLANLEKGRIQGQDRYSAARERHFDWRHRSLEMTGTTREIAEKIAVQTKYKAETIRKALQKLRKKNSSVGKIRA